MATPGGPGRLGSRCAEQPERPLRFTRALAAESVQRKAIEYDRARRRPLRFGQRTDQKHSRQRCRCRHLLAGADAGSGRRSAISGPAAGDSGQRGRRQCRSAGVAVGRGRDASLRIRRPARVPIDAGPGGHLSGLCAEIERGHGGHRRGPPRRARGAAGSGAAALRDSHYPGPSDWVTAKVINTRTTAPRESPRRIIWASMRVLPTGRPRLRAELAERLEKIRAASARRSSRRQARQNRRNSQESRTKPGREKLERAITVLEQLFTAAGQSQWWVPPRRCARRPGPASAAISCCAAGTCSGSSAAACDCVLIPAGSRAGFRGSRVSALRSRFPCAGRMPTPGKTLEAARM